MFAIFTELLYLPAELLPKAIIDRFLILDVNGVLPQLVETLTQKLGDILLVQLAFDSFCQNLQDRIHLSLVRYQIILLVEKKYLGVRIVTRIDIWC